MVLVQIINNNNHDSCYKNCVPIHKLAMCNSIHDLLPTLTPTIMPYHKSPVEPLHGQQEFPLIN